MLYKFLIANRGKILAETRAKTLGISEDRPTSAVSERGLSQFYDHLIRVMRREAEGRTKEYVGVSATAPGDAATRRHGRELSRLGYTISQVVHGYGVLCQAITEEATRADAPITASEFSVLNLSLDQAIAQAVTAFSAHSGAQKAEAATRMGFLVHELRNALAAASVAHAMIKKGVVGTGGSTNALLERNLWRMRDILDRSFSVVRLRNDKTSDVVPTLLVALVEEVEATASEEARSRGLKLELAVDPRLSVDVDRHYLISALSNLVQNALKYTKPGGIVRIRSRETEKDAVIEVEDRCGGLPHGKAEELFKAYTQKSADRSGLGLGLAITREAVARNGGTITVRDLPKKGCVFSITLPKLASARTHAGPAARRRHGAARSHA
jgi:signal transduction histidine kinase